MAQPDSRCPRCRSFNYRATVVIVVDVPAAAAGHITKTVLRGRRASVVEVRRGAAVFHCYSCGGRGV